MQKPTAACALYPSPYTVSTSTTLNTVLNHWATYRSVTEN